MDISFPTLVMPKVTAMGTVSFQTLVDGEYIWCEISCETLRQKFGAISWQADDLLYAFHQHKQAILLRARACLELNDGHPVLLTASNFQ